MKVLITHLIASIHEVEKEPEDTSKRIKDTHKCKIKVDAGVALDADTDCVSKITETKI